MTAYKSAVATAALPIAACTCKLWQLLAALKHGNSNQPDLAFQAYTPMASTHTAPKTVRRATPAIGAAVPDCSDSDVLFVIRSGI